MLRVERKHPAGCRIGGFKVVAAGSARVLRGKLRFAQTDEYVSAHE
jgi:hypothetical protein